MTITFAGHFTIGEKINETQLKTIREAKKSNKKLAILINDLDFKRKLQFFDIGGKNLLLRHYGARKKCGTTQPLCMLPEFKKIPGMIDWKLFNFALKEFKKTNLEIDEFIQTKVVPLAIARALEKYKLNKDAVQVFTERELRNKASKRLSGSRSKGEKSWVPLLEKTNTLNKVRSNISKIPVCSGIMLALYEKLSEAGYDSLIELCHKDDKKAIKNALCIYKELHHTFPKDPRWCLKTKYIYF